MIGFTRFRAPLFVIVKSWYHMNTSSIVYYSSELTTYDSFSFFKKQTNKQKNNKQQTTVMTSLASMHTINISSLAVSGEVTLSY